MQRLSRSLLRAISRTTSPSTPHTTTPFTPLTTTTTSNIAAMATTTPNSALSADTFLSLIKNRRTFYPLNKDLAIPPARIQELVGEALQHVPSAFNSQSNRAVVLFGAEHDKFWAMTADILKTVVPEAAWEATSNKLAMFQAGAGTVLFFEDQTVVKELQEKYALYADRFPVWAGHTSAMLQFAVWTVLEAEGLGANLQHYNPLVDAKVVETWGVPATWKLNSQLVFGGKTVDDAGLKTFAPLEEKLKVFGA